MGRPRAPSSCAILRAVSRLDRVPGLVGCAMRIVVTDDSPQLHARGAGRNSGMNAVREVRADVNTLTCLFERMTDASELESDPGGGNLGVGWGAGNGGQLGPSP